LHKALCGKHADLAEIAERLRGAGKLCGLNRRQRSTPSARRLVNIHIGFQYCVLRERRDWRRLERIAKMCQDLPDRPRAADRRAR
jgi:hypothetical protein